MLKFRDANHLAGAKLRSHKIWTPIFITIEVLLFTTLILSAQILSGLEQSLNTFSNEGLKGRYLASATNWRGSAKFSEDEAVVDRAVALYKQGLIDHAKIAQEIGIEYDKSSEENPVEYFDGQREFKNWSAYGQAAVKAAMDEKLPPASYAQLEALAEKHHAKNIFRATLIPANGSLLPLENNQEDLKKLNTPQSSADLSIFAYANFVDDDLLDYYKFENQPKLTGDTIPILLSFTQAENILGAENLENSNDGNKLARLQEIAEKSEQLQIQSCYRNESSRQAVLNAVATQREIERNKNNPNYTAPSLILAPPTTSCGATTTRKDTRTPEEKRQAQLQIEYQKRIGTYPGDPEQSIITFQVIGLVPSSDQNWSNSSTNLKSLFDSLTSVSLATPTIPNSYADQNSATIQKIFDTPLKGLYGATTSYTVEFESPSDLTNFSSESCELTNGADCATPEKPFLIGPSNNYKSIITQIKTIISQIIFYALTAIAVFSIFSITKTISRTIASSRKEIAVFRAIGFSRVDIAKIYLTYTLQLGAIISITSVALSLILGLVINQIFTSNLTNFLKYYFMSLNPELSTTLFVPNPTLLILTIFLVPALMLVSAILPIIINLRRNLVSGLKSD